MEPKVQSTNDLRALAATAASERRWTLLGWGLWIAITVVVVVYCIARPGKHTVTPTYWEASRQWWASRDMYGQRDLTPVGQHGFLYFPQAAILATPFALLPLQFAETLWRACNLGVLACAMWNLSPLISAIRPRRYFGLATSIAMPVVALSAQNGQVNIAVLGVMTLATVALMRGRHWTAACWLALAVAIKPQAMVLAMLVGALNARVRWRVLVALAALAALPWLRGDWGYVWQEHVNLIEKLRVAARPPPGANQDLGGLLWTLGLAPSDAAWVAIRATAAGATLALCWIARRRLSNLDALFHTLAFATLYIVLFNPRTESPTYSLVAIVVGFCGARAFLAGRPWTGALMALSSVCIGLNYELTSPRDRWLQPALALAWMVFLGARVCLRRAINAAEPVHDPLGTPPPPGA